jgi:asparagine synthase (glutamine-hydrolysing)
MLAANGTKEAFSGSPSAINNRSRNRRSTDANFRWSLRHRVQRRIYNFIELREILTRGGTIFRTQSDTEVILEGYRRWGADVVRYLNGMFAFVLWDRGEQSVFAARDRLGIKPLCWTIHRGALLVSSTLEPFHVLLREDRQLDFTAVRDLMTFDYIPVPHTILKGVHKLEPGSRLRWNLRKAEPEIDRYWSPPLVDDLAAVPDEFELEDLIERCVKRQMISDVPLGAFLSGGIDSSLLVAMMARNSSRPVRTFSVAFSEGDVDESSIAQLVASPVCDGSYRFEGRSRRARRTSGTNWSFG